MEITERIRVQAKTDQEEWKGWVGYAVYDNTPPQLYINLDLKQNKGGINLGLNLPLQEKEVKHEINAHLFLYGVRLTASQKISDSVWEWLEQVGRQSCTVTYTVDFFSNPTFTKEVGEVTNN